MLRSYLRLAQCAIAQPTAPIASSASVSGSGNRPTESRLVLSRMLVVSAKPNAGRPSSKSAVMTCLIRIDPSRFAQGQSDPIVAVCGAFPNRLGPARDLTGKQEAGKTPVGIKNPALIMLGARYARAAVKRVDT